MGITLWQLEPCVYRGTTYRDGAFIARELRVLLQQRANRMRTRLHDRDWSEQTIPFHVLNQQGWGTPAAFDPRTLINVNFQTSFGGGDSFSFSVDAISFY